MSPRRLLVACLLASVLALPATAAAQEGPAAGPGEQAVLFVANNWDGTADIIDPQSFRKLGRFNTVPDLQERLREIQTNPIRLGYYLAIRQLVGEGNDQYADDIFSSHDGRIVYVSRPSLADVVAIELATNRIVWRFKMEGQRSDHMAISPDGTRLLVSDSTARKVHALDTATGAKVGEFASGDSPHENNYSKDGTRVFHASIGMVYTPADQPVADSTKGDRWFQVVDARSFQILKRLDIGKIMRDQGYGDYSSAVRPMAISPDEKTFYFQLSFHHGFVEFDLDTEKVTRIANLPVSEEAQRTPREEYLLDSAHHGLAMNPEGTKLCAAGTMSDYAAIVRRDSFAFKTFAVGRKPYWSTNSGDGKYCFVSVSGDDQVVVLDYASEQEVARIPVGDHPQRMRMGLVRIADLATIPPSPGASDTRSAPKLRVMRAGIRDGRLQLRVRMTSRATGTLRGTFIAADRRTPFTVRIPAAARRGVPKTWTARVRVPAAQRRMGTGIVELRYAGDRRVRPGFVRSRGAEGKAVLRRTTLTIENGALRAEGTVRASARGVVRVRFAYLDDGGRERLLTYRARIRDGRWGVRELLPSIAARRGGDVSVQFTGVFARRIRGEQFTTRVAP